MDHYFNSIAKHLDDSGGDQAQQLDKQSQQQLQQQSQSQTNTTANNNNLISNYIMPNLPGPLPSISSSRRSSSGGGGGVRQGSFGNSTNVQVRQTSTGNRQSGSRQSSIGHQQQQQQQVNTVSINNIQTIQNQQQQQQQGGQQQQRLSTTSNPLDAKGEYYLLFIIVISFVSSLNGWECTFVLWSNIIY